MRNDVLNQIKLMGELVHGLNKSELARRFNCDRRTIDSYIKNPNARNRKPRKLESKLDEFKEIIIDKVDNFGASSINQEGLNQEGRFFLILQRKP